MNEAAGKVGLQKSPGLLPELEGLSGEEFQAALKSLPQSVRFYWQWKIKRMLDPNGTGDSVSYTTLEKAPGE